MRILDACIDWLSIGYVVVRRSFGVRIRALMATAQQPAGDQPLSFSVASATPTQKNLNWGTVSLKYGQILQGIQWIRPLPAW